MHNMKTNICATTSETYSISNSKYYVTYTYTIKEKNMEYPECKEPKKASRVDSILIDINKSIGELQRLNNILIDVLKSVLCTCAFSDPKEGACITDAVEDKSPLEIRLNNINYAINEECAVIKNMLKLISI